MTEQHTAPAKAKRAYRSTPVGAVGSTWAAMVALAASTLEEPVAVGGGEVDMMAGRAGEGRTGVERVVRRWTTEIAAGLEER